MAPRKRPAAATATKRPAAAEPTAKKQRTKLGGCCMGNTANKIIWHSWLIARFGSSMSDSEGSILLQSDTSDDDRHRPIVKHQKSHGQTVPPMLQSLGQQPCRCARQICLQQFSHCLDAVLAERQRFRALSHDDQETGTKTKTTLCCVPNVFYSSFFTDLYRKLWWHLPWLVDLLATQHHLQLKKYCQNLTLKKCFQKVTLNPFMIIMMNLNQKYFVPVATQPNYP